MNRILVILIISSVVLYSQEPHSIPFASNGNMVELMVSNLSHTNMNEVKVVIENPPDWITFTKKEMTIDHIKDNEESLTEFVFDVERQAPVGKEVGLVFKILKKTGELIGTKEIKIKVSPPDKFELFQNYPNPFNPTTTISYLLPVGSKVEVNIYNTLGQRITELVNEFQEPGFQRVEWNANSISSGMYIYTVDVNGADGKRLINWKKMMLIK